jgi:hypothetical protein
MSKPVNRWQNMCTCGAPKMRRSVTCNRCHLATRKSTCICGKPKLKTKDMCRECLHRLDRCACGELKSKRAKACTICRQREPAKKRCPGCRRLLIIDAYKKSKRRNGAYKRRSRCKKCEALQSKAWAIKYPDRALATKIRARAKRKANPVTAAKDRLSALKSSWKKRGLNADEVAAYVALHKVCEICLVDVLGHRMRAVDHDHKTGKFRGVLCQRCNNALGLFDDDIGKLGAAVNYLQKKRRAA